MNVLRFFSMSIKKNNHAFCTKDYYCTVTVSFHYHSWKGRPSLTAILHSAAWVLLNCIANRSIDSGIPKTSIDFTCFRYKDPDSL